MSLPFRKTSILGICHHHERRKIIVRAAHSIGHPRADTRIPHTADTGIQRKQGKRMIVGPTMARTLRHRGCGPTLVKNVGNPFPTLSILFEAEWRLHERADFLGEESDFVVEPFQLLAVSL